MYSKLVNNSNATTPRRPARASSWSLATRLTAWYAYSAFALVLVATAFLYGMLTRNFDQEEDLFLANSIQDMRELLNSQPDNMTVLAEEVAENSRYVQVYMRLLTENGRMIIETPGMTEMLAPSFFPPPIRADEEPGKGADVALRTGRSFRVLAAQAVTGQPDGEMRVIQVALSQAKKRSLLATYRRHLWRVLGFALAACTLIGYQIARRGMRPIGEISQAAQRVRSTTLDRRISVAKLPAELLTLANMFNEMLAHLQESFDRLSQFSANIAHELRTPVNNLRGMAEVALRDVRSPDEYRETLGSCLEECVRLSRLIDSLLFLARAEQTQMPIHREPLNVGDELSTVRDFYEAAGTETDITISVSAEPDLVFPLDRTLFQRAVGNLITNALAHTPHGGAITLKASRRQEALCIEVSDTGCGIPSEQLPYVFDRFYRVHPAGPFEPRGMGLGLAIVKSIVTLHGGSMLITSDVGAGTKVTMQFPT